MRMDFSHLFPSIYLNRGMLFLPPHRPHTYYIQGSVTLE